MSHKEKPKNPAWEMALARSSDQFSTTRKLIEEGEIQRTLRKGEYGVQTSKSDQDRIAEPVTQGD